MIAADRQHHCIRRHRLRWFPAQSRLSPDEPSNGTPSRIGAEYFASFDVGDDVVAQHEALRVIAGIGKAGKLALPVWRHQAERVPALRPPGVGDPVLLENDVIDVVLAQMMAHRESGLAAADDGDADVGRC